MDPLALESVCAPLEDVVSLEIEGELIIVPIASGIRTMEDNSIPSTILACDFIAV